MDSFNRKRWIRLVILLGVVYFVVGVGFGELAKTSVSEQGVFAWRLAAWIASAVVFAAHIGYEHFKLGNSPRVTALHAALAVAVGSFLLAVAATIHAVIVPAHAPFYLFFLALIIWPTVTAAPAFLVALVASAVLNRLPHRA